MGLQLTEVVAVYCLMAEPGEKDGICVENVKKRWRDRTSGLGGSGFLEFLTLTCFLRFSFSSTGALTATMGSLTSEMTSAICHVQTQTSQCIPQTLVSQHPHSCACVRERPTIWMRLWSSEIKPRSFSVSRETREGGVWGSPSMSFSTATTRFLKHSSPLRQCD